MSGGSEGSVCLTLPFILPAIIEVDGVLLLGIFGDDMAGAILGGSRDDNDIANEII